MAEETVEIRRYVVSVRESDEFERMLEVHWRALRIYELVTDERPLIFRRAGDDETTFVEVFSWVSPSAAVKAADLPAIRSVREPMTALCRSVEDGRYEPRSMSLLVEQGETDG